jgi:hypothetical protein
VSRRAAILGWSAVPVGTYQRAGDGDPMLEHELAVDVVMGAASMAGIGRDDIDGVVSRIRATIPTRATSTPS